MGVTLMGDINIIDKCLMLILVLMKNAHTLINKGNNHY